MRQSQLQTIAWTLGILGSIGLVAGLMAMRQMEPAHRANKSAETSSEPAEVQVAGAGDQEPVDPNRPIFQSPRDCYAALQELSRRGDEAGQLQCYDERTANERVGWYAYYLEREIFYERDNADAARQLFADHDVEPGRVMGYVHGNSEMPVDKIGELVAIIGSKIRQQGDFVATAAKLVKVTVGGDPIPAHELELTDIDVRGQLAVGTLKQEGSDFSSSCYFQRYTGSWLITKDPQVKSPDP